VQRGLFDDEPESEAPAGRLTSPADAPPGRVRAADLETTQQLAAQHDEASALAARLPPRLHFGTSSWSFPGWAGIVYSARRSQTDLAREGLREYATHPLLTTVGIDRSYYAPIPIDDFRRYADQLPDGFRCCIKAPSSVTSYAVGDRDRPVLNVDFLSPSRLIEDLLQPCALAFAAHTGPVIIECPPVPRGLRLDPFEFAERLDSCLAQLPREFTYAVELRDRTLLTPSYAAVLARHGATHTYNYWSAMPLPGAQAAVVPLDGVTSDSVVIRLLLRPGTRYADQREAFHPFNALAEPDEAMRADVVSLVERANANQKRIYLLVNNKAEGSSPLTVMELARRVAGASRG
jgi:uncharacterized protein YecE (DUF72 family)